MTPISDLARLNKLTLYRTCRANASFFIDRSSNRKQDKYCKTFRVYHYARVDKCCLLLDANFITGPISLIFRQILLSR